MRYCVGAENIEGEQDKYTSCILGGRRPKKKKASKQTNKWKEIFINGDKSYEGNKQGAGREKQEGNSFLMCFGERIL